MSDPTATIYYTETDEAPALATYSLLPILRRFTASTGINFEKPDISLSGRILANFPDHLKPGQQIDDWLTRLGELAKTPEANIIKLPNISASIPQLQSAIKELQDKGFAVPDYPEEPQSDAERAIQATYAKVLGSAVNPVLREGNSDRRVAMPVKAYAKKNPHSMGAWSTSSKSHVAHMESDDFFGSEVSHIMDAADDVRIEHVAADGTVTVLKESTPLQAGEVIDAAVMRAAALRAFLDREVAAAKEQGVLVSLHVKATMMKVSDPIIFGHMVRAYYAQALDKHAATLERVGFEPNNGIGDLYAKIAALPDAERQAIEKDVEAAYGVQAPLAMVDSDRGITNLHVPSDVIIDASMPAAIRASGQMWGPDGAQHDTKFIIPDRSYAGVYQETVEHCREHGAFDVPTMGNVSNVGLMAQKAEEYGSHDKTFQPPSDGQIRVVGRGGETLLSHDVATGDIWRMCQTKDAPIRDWVRLGVARARATGAPAIFWLNEDRAHDASLIKKVNAYLPDHDTEGLDLRVLAPIEATRQTLARVRNGEDTISVTGNVLRDYLTDLFPILELGTSAKMLSIVPLLAGGGLFETGAGGSAPKHVQQFEQEGHLRWDSLGEFLAVAVSLEEIAERLDDDRVRVLARTLNTANSKFLDTNKSPSRKVNEIDNRGSHYYLALYWAEALAEQTDVPALRDEFAPVAKALAEGEQQIIAELIDAQGEAMDVGGYFKPDPAMAESAMRPSATLNAALT
ncbi:MAG: NADP-dependent isocitrate dehydrogenase [Pseudomonadota bacterium]